MAETLFGNPNLSSAINALRQDLLAEDGPRISTMRNYRFAILAYDPRLEFELRSHVRRLTDELRTKNWNVLAISLYQLFLDRLERQGEDYIQNLIEREKRLFEKDQERGLRHIVDRISRLIEGEGGLVADVIRLIDEFADEHPGEEDHTLIFLGRAGALYPFFRSSALLKHLDGKTRSIPVVLLYPGERREVSALSFMGELTPDRDYRPRIYS